MEKVQVFLKADQKAELKSIARRTGAKQSELIRRGVDLVIEQEAAKKGDWKAALDNVAGIWADRDDLDEVFGGLRKDLNERHKKLFVE